MAGQSEVTVVGVDLSPVGLAKTWERSRVHGLEARVSAYCLNACQLETVLASNSIDLAGELVFPHFKLFDAAKKYVFPNSRAFAALVQALDHTIDLIPGMRRWSAGMWVVARKEAQPAA